MIVKTERAHDPQIRYLGSAKYSHPFNLDILQ